MIIGKKNIIKFKNTNSPLNIKQDMYENKTNKQILVKKDKLNINENMTIKAHVMGKNSKNEKKNNNNLSEFNIIFQYKKKIQLPKKRICKIRYVIIIS